MKITAGDMRAAEERRKAAEEKRKAAAEEAKWRRWTPTNGTRALLMLSLSRSLVARFTCKRGTARRSRFSETIFPFRTGNGSSTAQGRCTDELALYTPSKTVAPGWVNGERSARGESLLPLSYLGEGEIAGPPPLAEHAGEK